MNTDLKELEDGLIVVTPYDGVMRDTAVTDLADLQRSLIAISPELDRLDTERETHLKATKGRFNVFTVLRGAGDETGLHTSWLGFLLNPKERHDCGDLFLKLFLTRLAKGIQLHKDAPFKPSELDKLAGLHSATVSRERRVDKGQLDIWINLPGWGGIVIENKIYAGEQDQQLERYGEFLDGRYKNWLLLYLTRDGCPSKTAEKYIYYRISYREHILDWLDDCLRATYQYVNINQALQQYKDVVYQITGGLPMEKEYMTAIVNLIEKYPAIIKHYQKLGPAIEELRTIKQREFWGAVNKYLKQYDIIIGDRLQGRDSGGYDYWPVKHPSSKETRLWIFLEGQDKKDFFICVWPQKEADSLDKDLTKKMHDALSKLKTHGDFSNARAIIELPETFTDKELGSIIACPDELLKRAEESSKIIQQYVEVARQICPELILKG
ncbi:MAG: PD-(D/E)XK nuclease family protein [Planctomycetia bacterium]|nr:PD-(D/E)XK nuclease family protein [Planctomycetia bacterium]